MKFTLFIVALIMSLSGSSQRAMFHANNYTAAAGASYLVDFQFSDNLTNAGTNGITGAARAYNDYSSAVTPTYSSGALSLNNTYGVVLSSVITFASGTIEFAMTAATAGRDLQILTGPSNTAGSGGTSNKISFDYEVGYNHFTFRLSDASLADWNLGSGFSRDAYHTYKITYTGSVAELFVDGVSQGTISGLSSAIDIGVIGMGHPSLNFSGTLDYFKIY
jgi:hypothetical protein